MENTCTVVYKIDFHSYWHIGSGLSGNTYADLLVLKNDEFLPFIPGKTLKGLLREAAELLMPALNDDFPDDFIKVVFGRSPDDDNLRNETYTSEGISFFSNAQLPENIAKEIITSNDFRNILYKTISSTALDKEGIAKTNSLRQFEVCVPLTLFGMVHQFPSDEKFIQALKYCLSYIKRMGLQRNRGFGNCTLSLFKSDNIQ
jgi:CRISPR/Cas system CSM-associated protein Csm3 (group 7 of RAMP superfamily)